MDSLGVNRLLGAICADPTMHEPSILKVELSSRRAQVERLPLAGRKGN